MKSPVSRRDFLKLSSMLPLSVTGPRLARLLGGPAAANAGAQNVIVVVFDAFSAYNISLYGYKRPTTPNLTRLSKRAIVYHNHFAGSNFTTSGTASLMTGSLPWTHRAIHPNGEVAPTFVTRNFFSVFHDYYRLAYTHSGWAYTLLRQFQREMDDLIPTEKLLVGSYDNFLDILFKNDKDLASVAWARNMRVADGGYAYSLFLSHLYQVLQEGKIANLKPMYPRGLPTTGSDNGFLLEDAVDFIGKLLPVIPHPFFGYFHYMPPHFPYRTSVEFYNRFKGDGFKTIDKPVDIFTKGHPDQDLPMYRTEYDEYILYVDHQFGRFFDALESSGLLKNSWLIVTSDHGEMFERGIMGHSVDVLYQPLTRIPLLIFEPGRDVGTDIYSVTSAADILPTLTYLTGHPHPDWTEGVPLPPFAPGSPDPNRNVYAVRAVRNDPDAALTRASTVLVRWPHKLHYYFGYSDVKIPDMVKLFDIQADPEEMVDLSSTETDVTAELLGELKSKLAEVNKPYL